MTHKEFLEFCENKVKELANCKEVFLVWSCKTIQNSKCIMADDKTAYLHEFTMNGNTKEIYHDQYEKLKKQTYNV